MSKPTEKVEIAFSVGFCYNWIVKLLIVQDKQVYNDSINCDLNNDNLNLYNLTLCIFTA